MFKYMSCEKYKILFCFSAQKFYIQTNDENVGCEAFDTAVDAIVVAEDK